MKKSQAIGTRIDSTKFGYGKKTQTFFADISELEAQRLDAFDQLWHDEATKGFVMVSAVTGNEVPFVLDHTEREADGDTRAWRFVPHQHAIEMNAGLRKISVIIFNT